MVRAPLCARTPTTDTPTAGGPQGVGEGVGRTLPVGSLRWAPPSAAHTTPTATPGVCRTRECLGGGGRCGRRGPSSPEAPTRPPTCSHDTKKRTRARHFFFSKQGRQGAARAHAETQKIPPHTPPFLPGLMGSPRLLKVMGWTRSYGWENLQRSPNAHVPVLRKNAHGGRGGGGPAPPPPTAAAAAAAAAAREVAVAAPADAAAGGGGGPEAAASCSAADGAGVAGSGSPGEGPASLAPGEPVEGLTTAMSPSSGPGEAARSSSGMARGRGRERVGGARARAGRGIALPHAVRQGRFPQARRARSRTGYSARRGSLGPKQPVHRRGLLWI